MEARADVNHQGAQALSPPSYTASRLSGDMLRPCRAFIVLYRLWNLPSGGSMSVDVEPSFELVICCERIAVICSSLCVAIWFDQDPGSRCMGILAAYFRVDCQPGTQTRLPSTLRTLYDSIHTVYCGSVQLASSSRCSASRSRHGTRAALL